MGLRPVLRVVLGDVGCGVAVCGVVWGDGLMGVVVVVLGVGDEMRGGT